MRSLGPWLLWVWAGAMGHTAKSKPKAQMGLGTTMPYNSYAHSQGEKFHRGDAYIKGEKTTFYKKTLFCFVFQYVCFLFCCTSWQFVWPCYLYGALSLFLYLCFVVLIASCLYVGHAYILLALCFIDCMFR